MILLKVKVENYKSIEDSGWVNINDVTCLVGKNESGKTTFLNALYKLNPHGGNGDFDPILEYPRKGYSAYKRIHEKDPATVITAIFKLTKSEIKEIEEDLGTDVMVGDEIAVYKGYSNNRTWDVKINEQVVTKFLLDNADIESGAVKESLYQSKNLQELLDKLNNLQSSNTEITQLSTILTDKFTDSLDLDRYIINNYLVKFIPKFVYFDDYNIMKGEVSIPYLKSKKLQSPNILNGSEKTILSLLDLAGVELEDFENQLNYEKLKADLEAASISITDEVFNFWTQNKQLEVEFDVSAANPNSDPPLNQGPLLHIRIRNNKHRVTVSFSERSKGFVWFFSFLAYFSEIEEKDSNLILLLDEPGLSLHAKAQNDFLHFIDVRLKPKYQVLYTTHSPFMINPQNFKIVRTVEDVEGKGTVISEEIYKNDKDTVFPLQAALGYELAQTLFIGPNCLLVEGPSDLIYLQILNEVLIDKGYEGLDEKWIITPVGGADKVSTFISLLGANQINIAVLIDFTQGDMQRINNLISNSSLKKNNLIKINEYVNKTDADIEDLFDENLYIDIINKAYSLDIKVDELLSNNPRIVKRIEQYFKNENIGKHFNHYKPASFLLKNQAEFIDKINNETIIRVDKLFKKINSLIKSY